MLSEKFYECLNHEGVVAIATCSSDHKPHMCNTWNSYIIVTEDEKLLIPAAGMIKTERNAAANPSVEITLGSREVMGYRAMGTGFSLTGTVKFLKEGSLFDTMKEKCPFANRVLVFTPESCKQTL